MTKFNPEVHTLIYDDGCMIQFWEQEEAVIKIWHNDVDEDGEQGFVCVEIEELKKIVETCDK